MAGETLPFCFLRATYSTVILRSRALARRLEGSPLALVAHPSRLAQEGEHLRMTAVLFGHQISAHHATDLGHNPKW
jgi:hypothetical protein